MKNKVLSFLVPLAFFAGLMAMFLVPWFVADRLLGLRAPMPGFIGTGFLAATLYVLYRLAIQAQTKERKVLSTIQHDIFGEVKCYQDHWEARVLLTDDLPAVDIWGEAKAPSEIQAATFTAMRQRQAELLPVALEAARSYFSTPDFSLVPEELKLESVYLASDAIGSFDLIFAAPTYDRLLPNGVTVTFADFAVDEVSDNH
jgi:hypothetical protein